MGKWKKQQAAVYIVLAPGKLNFVFLSRKWSGFGGKDRTCLLHSLTPDSLRSAEGQRSAFEFPQAEDGTDSQVLPFSKKIWYKAPPNKS